MSDQRPLFDVERTTPQACPVAGCEAWRLAGEPKVATCSYDIERYVTGVSWHRPRGCLNYPKPEHQPIPY